MVGAVLPGRYQLFVQPIERQLPHGRCFLMRALEELDAAILGAAVLAVEVKQVVADVF